MKKINELTVFYIGFILFIICCFLRNTSFSVNKDILWLITIFILSAKCVMVQYTKKELMIFFSILCVFGLSSYLAQDFYLMGIPVVLISCKNIPLKKIIQIIFLVNLGMSIITIFSSLFFNVGIISMTRVYRSDMVIETRYYFGFVHPNQLSATCFSIVASYIYLYWHKLTWIRYFLIFLVILLVNYYTDSNTSFYVSILLLLMTFYLKILDKKGYYKFNKVFILLTILIFVFSIFSMLYINEIPFLQKIDYSLSSRLSVTNKYYNLNGLSLFGKYIYNEFDITLDQGIVNVLLRYGLVLSLFICYCIFKFYVVEKKNLKKLLLVFIFIVYSIVETEILDIYRNIGIYIIFYSLMKYKFKFIRSGGRQGND